MQNSDFIGVFSIRPAWDAYEKVREANEILHQFISTNFEHLLIGCDSAIRASSIAFALHDNYSTRVQYPK